jgi:hypothetical protein
MKRSIATLKSTLLKYVSNSFLLVVPALVVDLLWASRLPAGWQFDVFWRDIPTALAYGERISSLVVNILPVFMTFGISTQRQRKGLAAYIVGMLAYNAAWAMMVYLPQSTWSISLIGSTATAWMPLLWLIGIGLVGDSFYFSIPYKPWVYILPSGIFVAFHFSHALLVYMRF